MLMSSSCPLCQVVSKPTENFSGFRSSRLKMRPFFYDYACDHLFFIDIVLSLAL